MTVTSDQDVRQLKKRFTELAEKSYLGNQYTFTGFLGLAEQNVFYEFVREYGRAAYTIWGGHALCERKMVRFDPQQDVGYEEAFPIVCIHIMPLQKKFAEELTHRDYLGAVMNLGIERSTCGDILTQDKEAFLFSQKKISGHILRQLDRVRHTSVSCGLFEGEPEVLLREPEQEAYLVSSERLDCVLAKIYHLSRSQSVQLFREKRVYVSGILCENNCYVPKENDLVTVRGCGRFLYRGVQYESKKGKLGICIER